MRRHTISGAVASARRCVYEPVARRLSDALDRKFLLSGVPVHVEASIGIARFPHDGRDATALLRCADSAMYAAKDLSTELELFDGERDHHSPTRLKRLGELRQALTRGELVLHYQPKLRLGTGDVVGVEALVRWLHPDQGLLPPGEFVPLAEQTGLIKPLTSFVLREALVAGVPGAAFGLSPHLRLSFAASKADLQEAIFDPAILDTPRIDAAFTAQQSATQGWQVEVKRRGAISRITYPFNPLDAIGWHGELAPVRPTVRDHRHDVCAQRGRRSR